MSKYNGQLSDRLWPIHLKLQEDELLSSWLVRLAFAYNLKTHSFCNIIWPGKQVWNRDIDQCADDQLISVLANKTGAAIERVEEAGLASYEGYLFEHHNPHGSTTWIMPIGVYHRMRTRYGLQYCPKCLASDEQPYYRKHWRLALSTVCNRHQVFLADYCPSCKSPLSFHKLSRYSDNIALCYQCGFNLRKTKTDKCTYLEADRQFELLYMLKSGYSRVDYKTIVYANLYFPVLRQIIRFLSGGKHGRGLRRQVQIIFPNVSLNEARSLEVEHQRVKARHELITIATWLLEDWPLRFVTICEESSTWCSQLFSYTTPKTCPFWFSDTIEMYLNHLRYHSSQRH